MPAKVPGCPVFRMRSSRCSATVAKFGLQKTPEIGDLAGFSFQNLSWSETPGEHEENRASQRFLKSHARFWRLWTFERQAKGGEFCERGDDDPYFNRWHRRPNCQMNGSFWRS